MNQIFMVFALFYLCTKNCDALKCYYCPEVMDYSFVCPGGFQTQTCTIDDAVNAEVIDDNTGFPIENTCAKLYFQRGIRGKKITHYVAGCTIGFKGHFFCQADELRKKYGIKQDPKFNFTCAECTTDMCNKEPFTGNQIWNRLLSVLPGSASFHKPTISLIVLVVVQAMYGVVENWVSV